MPEPSPSTPGEVVRSLYDALGRGDIPAVLATLHPDLIADEPPALPFGGVHNGRGVFLERVLGAMAAHAATELGELALFEGDAGVVATVRGWFVAHTTGERFAVAGVELHEVVDGVIRSIDVYLKDPAALAAFYARVGKSGDGTGLRQALPAT